MGTGTPKGDRHRRGDRRRMGTGTPKGDKHRRGDRRFRGACPLGNPLRPHQTSQIPDGIHSNWVKERKQDDAENKPVHDEGRHTNSTDEFQQKSDRGIGGREADKGSGRQ